MNPFDLLESIIHLNIDATQIERQVAANYAHNFVANRNAFGWKANGNKKEMAADKKKRSKMIIVV